MPNEYPNLTSNIGKTPEELSERGRKAGQASGVARRRYKTFREGLKQILQMEVDDPEIKAALQALGLDGTFSDAINMAQIAAAGKKGDTEAARYVRDTVGEKPREGVEIGGLDDRPIQTIDLSRLTDEQLQALAEKRRNG